MSADNSGYRSTQSIHRFERWRRPYGPLKKQGTSPLNTRARRITPSKDFTADRDHAALDSAGVPAPGAKKQARTQRTEAKQGTKRHRVVDAQGLPLAVLVSAAKVHDSRMMLVTVDAIVPNPAVDRAGDRTSCPPTFIWPCCSLAAPSPPWVSSANRLYWTSDPREQSTWTVAHCRS